MVYFWLDFRSQGSNFDRASVAKDIFSANFDLIPPFFRSEWQDLGQIWPIACKIASKVVNLVTFPIVKGLILTHFPLPSVWFWLSVSIAKGMVATTRDAHPRQNSSEYPRPPTPTTTTPGTYTYTGHMTVILEKGGNFENSIPIPNYQIHLVLDQIPYDLKTKSNIQEWHLGVILKESSHLENIWMFYSVYHNISQFLIIKISPIHLFY